MKNLIFISMICVFAGLQSCKPRGSSLSSSQTEEELIDTQFKTLYSYKAISQTFGLHVNNHPYYRRAYIYAIDAFTKITAELQQNKKARANSFRLKMAAISWLADELVNSQFEEFSLTEFSSKPESTDKSIPVAVNILFQDMENKKITAQELLTLARLRQETAPTCSYTRDPALMNRKLAVCYSFETCGEAVNQLKSFTRFTQNDMHRKYVSAVDKLIDDVSKDIECFVDSESKNLLKYRVDTLRLTQKFHKAFKFEPFYRPVENNYGENISVLQGELRSHIREAEDHFIRGDDPSRVKAPVINALRDDLKYKAYLDLDFERFVHDEDRIGDPEDIECEDESCSQITINAEPEKRQAMEQMVDDSAGFAAAAYTHSRALLAYIDRVSMNDIRPWLNDLEQRAREWRDWRFQLENSGTPRPESLDLISPTVAFNMLTTFYKHEAHLPMRRQYLRTMRFMVRNYYQFEDQSQMVRNEKSLTDNRILDSFEEATNEYDKTLVSYSKHIGFSGQNLLRKEADLTTEEHGYPQYFHSLMASFSEYITNVGEFDKAAKNVYEVNQQRAELSGDKLLDEETNKRFKEANQRLNSHQTQATSAALELACLSRGAGEQMQTFYQTQLNEPVMACWKWAHEQKNSQLFKWIMRLGATSTFEKEQGFTGNFPLERVCRPPGSVSPISWSKKFQIDHNAEETLKCAETTMAVQQESYMMAGSMILMPLMMGGGAIVSQLIIRRVMTARITNFMASRGAAFLATRLTGSATAKGVGSAASDALMLRGAYSSAPSIGRFAKLLDMRGLAAWTSRKVGGITLSASSHLLSAAFLTVANRTLFGALGMQSFVGKEYSDKYGYVLGGAIDWARETMINAAIFMSFGAFHGLSGTGSAYLASALPKSSKFYTFSTSYMPFFGTVAFFSATPQLMSVTNQIVKSSTGYDLELHDDENAHGFYYNFLHSFLITLAFKGHHKYSHTYTPQALTKWLQKKGLKPPGSGKAPAEAEMISKRAEELRHGRIFRNAEKSVDSFRLQLAIEDSHRLQSTPKQDSAYSGSAGRLEAKEGNELIQIGFQDPMTLFGLKTGFGPQAAEIQRVLKIGVKMNYKEKLDPQTRDAIIKYITKIDAKLVKELDVNYQKFVRRMDAQIEKIRQEPTVDMNRLKIAALLKQQGTIVYNKTKNIETRYEYLTKVNRVRAYLHAQAQMPVATP